MSEPVDEPQEIAVDVGDIDFDELGRPVITNPEFARFIRRAKEAGHPQFTSAVVMGGCGCVNTPCS